MSSLDDYDTTLHAISYDKLLVTDKYMLHLLHAYIDQVTVHMHGPGKYILTWTR